MATAFTTLKHLKITWIPLSPKPAKSSLPGPTFEIHRDGERLCRYHPILLVVVSLSEKWDGGAFSHSKASSILITLNGQLSSTNWISREESSEHMSFIGCLMSLRVRISLIYLFLITFKSRFTPSSSGWEMLASLGDEFRFTYMSKSSENIKVYI